MHLIVFDIDGTLADSNAFDGQLYVKALESVLGVRIDSNWTSYENVTDSGILDEILAKEIPPGDHSHLRSQAQSVFVGLVADYMHDRGGRIPEIPGARAFVERLAAHPDVALAFATGGWQQTAMMKLRGIGLEPEGLCLASASDAISRLEIMKLAEARALAGDNIERRTYFGDGLWDQRVSAELGYDFIGIGDRVNCSIRFPNFLSTNAILSELSLE